jgi:transcriptional regulator with XRE-family HTH domain
MPMEPVGILIARARQRQRMTQAQLADALGVAESTVANWERNEHYPARYAGAIEALLDITIPPRGEAVPA